MIVFIFGACFGSFLNVCIYRLPRDLSIVKPRSFCPRCHHVIPWFDNIPVVSFLLLQGRCRSCKGKISYRYVSVEILTGLITLLIWNQGPAGSHSIVEITLQIVLAYALIVVSLIDLEFYVIPNEITYSFFIIAVVSAFALPSHLGMIHRWMALGYSFFGALIGGGSLWLIGWIAKIFMKKEAMGLGDVKLMAMAGAWMGWKAALGSIMIASVVGSIVGLILILLRRVQLESRIPFGPFLSIGIFVFMLWGEQIFAWYLKMLYPVQYL